MPSTTEGIAEASGEIWSSLPLCTAIKKVQHPFFPSNPYKYDIHMAKQFNENSEQYLNSLSSLDPDNSGTVVIVTIMHVSSCVMPNGVDCAAFHPCGGNWLEWNQVYRSSADLLSGVYHLPLPRLSKDHGKTMLKLFKIPWCLSFMGTIYGGLGP